MTLFTFFSLLGGRSLNEPDEGRYAEIAREMIELNDWLVPHLWYVPHLDKPPLTYWAVAISISVFGENEWAVRLPLAAVEGGSSWSRLDRGELVAELVFLGLQIFAGGIRGWNLERNGF